MNLKEKIEELAESYADKLGHSFERNRFLEVMQSSQGQELLRWVAEEGCRQRVLKGSFDKWWDRFSGGSK